jgi:lipopolysaccharide heptosyltransferase II
MKKFLVINPFGIGDVLFTTPLIRALKENFPDAKVGYWCNERASAVLKNNPYVDKIIALSRGDLKRVSGASKLEGLKRFLGLLKEIRKERYDFSLDFSLDHRYSLFSKLLGIRQRIGLSYKNRGLFFTRKIDLEGYDSKHVVEYYLELLKFLNIEPKTKDLDLFVSQPEKAKIRHTLARYGIKEGDLLVGMIPGGGESWGNNATFKRWSALKFAQLADRLADGFSAKILLLGSESEGPLADIIVAAAKNKITNLVGKTTTEELVALISVSGLVITNDGGPLHKAVALRVKTVSIFGPVDERVYGPYPPSDRYIVVKRDLKCRPCYKRFHFNGCAFNRSCIDEITVDEVFQAAAKLINKK